jgi:predicted nucleic acid-binding protein
VNFLLDTNVVSEWVKPHPNPGVVAWLDGMDEDRVFLSVITLAELRYGVERLDEGKRRRRLTEWLEQELTLRFEGRILDVDSAIADRCGKVTARSEAAGRPIGAMDALLAATAEVHQLTMVTHNTSDFSGILKDMLNPWLKA